jgi:cyclophilin family peptidyl-prolyl cis-trans isomerase/HEAT repeat protein
MLPLRDPRAAWRLGLCLLVLAAGPVARLQAQEPANLNDLARLLSIEDRRAFDLAALRAASQHPDSVVRRRAAMTLGRLADRNGLPLLYQLLEDRDSLVRIEAAFAVGEVGDSASVRELVRQLDRLPRDGGVLGVELVTAIAKCGGAAADSALVRFLQRFPPVADGNDLVAAAALQETWRLGARSQAAGLLPGYLRAARGLWRQNAAWAATRLRLPAAAPVLLEAADDTDPLVRAWVARGLAAPTADSARVPRTAFVSALRPLVTDDDAGVRVQALRALGTFEDSALASLAAPRLSDRDANVAIQAAATLGQLRGSQAAAALADRIASAGTSGMRRALLTALARVDGPQAVSLAAARAADEDWRERALLAEVIGIAGGADAPERLAPLLADAEPRVVAAAVGALAAVTERGDTVALGLARGLLGHPDIGVRAAATGIVGRERALALIPVLVAAYRRAETDDDNDARLAAVEALADAAEAAPLNRTEVERLFLGAVPRSPHYLVRRAAASRLGEAVVRRRWGAVLPVQTGRSEEEYRELVRRYLVPEARIPQVSIETERGTIVLALYPWDAPMTVDNFLRLADRRFFDNGRWHRVVPNFVVQDGDPRGDGSGGPGTTIRDEINRRRYDRGTLGMALAGPDTGGSQFFITLAPQPHLDGGYTVFGRVVTGWNALDQTVQGDRIRRIFR